MFQLKIQSAFTGSFSNGFHTAMINISATVEYNLLDAEFLRFTGDGFTYQFALVDFRCFLGCDIFLPG